MPLGDPAYSPHGSLLLVDDEAHLRFILGSHLRAAGFEVIEANDGLDAIRLAQQRKPEVIIMDVGLANMDGIAATRALKSDVATADIPVIMLTARSNPADVVRGLEAGAQEYLVKPFDVTEVLARVRTVYRLGRAKKELDRLNGQLEKEVTQKTRRLQTLYEYMRDLNRASSQDEIYGLIVQAVTQITRARRVSLFTRDEGSDTLACRRATGIDPSAVGTIRVPMSAGITGQVFRSGKTLAARAIGRADRQDFAYDRDAFVSTPLVTTNLETQDGTIGVLNVTERPDESEFSREEIDCIRSIADAGAIALDNVVRKIRLQHSVRVLLQTVGHLAEYRDEETTAHLQRVSSMARILAEQIRHGSPYEHLVCDDFIDQLVHAAPMHDIGKVGIPDDILTKPGRLTDEEFQIMKTHTDIGRRVLSRAVDPSCPNPLLQMCVDIAHCHHERWDGGGYPRRIKGEQIPLAARMIALVDAYDAMTSERCYKQAIPHEVAVQRIRTDAGRHFDPVLVEAFLQCHERFQDVCAERAVHAAPLVMP